MAIRLNVVRLLSFSLQCQTHISWTENHKVLPCANSFYWNNNAKERRMQPTEIHSNGKTKIMKNLFFCWKELRKRKHNCRKNETNKIKKKKLLFKKAIAYENSLGSYSHFPNYLFFEFSNKKWAAYIWNYDNRWKIEVKTNENKIQNIHLGKPTVKTIKWLSFHSVIRAIQYCVCVWACV